MMPDQSEADQVQGAEREAAGPQGPEASGGEHAPEAQIAGQSGGLMKRIKGLFHWRRQGANTSSEDMPQSEDSSAPLAQAEGPSSAAIPAKPKKTKHKEGIIRRIRGSRQGRLLRYRWLDITAYGKHVLAAEDQLDGLRNLRRELDSFIHEKDVPEREYQIATLKDLREELGELIAQYASQGAEPERRQWWQETGSRMWAGLCQRMRVALGEISQHPDWQKSKIELQVGEKKKKISLAKVAETFEPNETSGPVDGQEPSSLQELHDQLTAFEDQLNIASTVLSREEGTQAPSQDPRKIARAEIATGYRRISKQLFDLLTEMKNEAFWKEQGFIPDEVAEKLAALMQSVRTSITVHGGESANLLYVQGIEPLLVQLTDLLLDLERHLAGNRLPPDSFEFEQDKRERLALEKIWKRRRFLQASGIALGAGALYGSFRTAVGTYHALESLFSRSPAEPAPPASDTGDRTPRAERDAPPPRASDTRTPSRPSPTDTRPSPADSASRPPRSADPSRPTAPPRPSITEANAEAELNRGFNAETEVGRSVRVTLPQFPSEWSFSVFYRAKAGGPSRAADLGEGGGTRLITIDPDIAPDGGPVVLKACATSSRMSQKLSLEKEITIQPLIR